MTNPDMSADVRRVASPGPSTAQSFALGAVIGPVLFTVTWLVLGWLSPGYTLFGHHFTQYSPISQPISGLGMGTTAPYMNTAFVLTGLMLAVGSIGTIRTAAAADPAPDDRICLRRAAMALLACTGIGQAIDGIFDLEAATLHGIGFILAVGTPVVSFLVAGRYFRGIPQWRRFGSWLLIGCPLTAVLVALFFVTFQPTADGAEHGMAGLVQRAAVIEVHVWFVAMGWLARRQRQLAMITASSGSSA